MPHIEIPPFQPDTTPGSGPAEEDGLGPGFTLGAAQSGLRSPDAIDRPGSYLTVTTSVGVQAMPPEQLAQLQAALARAGLTPGSYRPTGVLDEDTTAALLELKRDAAASGLSDMDTLRTRIETAAQAEAAGPRRSRNRTVTAPVFTDPATARATARATFTSELGREPTAAEYAAYRARLRDAEAGADVTTTTTTAGPGGNTRTRVSRSDDTTDPSAAVVADEMVRRGALGRERNTKMAAIDYYQAAMSILGAGGGNL